MLTSLLWVLAHLVLLYFYGSVVIMEENKLIISGEIVMVSVVLMRFGHHLLTELRALR